MARAQRLASFWGWLPAFRAVAETQHLPTAARQAHVTPSSLSRRIRLLEEDIGVRLFDRVGRNIELNEAGEAFLLAVRDAMRLVDEGLAAIGPDRTLGSVCISAASPFVPIFVLPALARLTGEHPGLTPHVGSVPDAAVPARLLAGDVDVALTDEPSGAEALAIEALGDLGHGVYRGRSHPLRRSKRPTRAEVLAHPFVAPPADERGRPIDAWPIELERNVGLTVSHMQAAIEACESGRYLCALPDVVARRAGLVRVSFARLPTTRLYLVRRRPLPIAGRVELAAEALRARAQEVLRSQKPT